MWQWRDSRDCRCSHICLNNHHAFLTLLSFTQDTDDNLCFAKDLFSRHNYFRIKDNSAKPLTNWPLTKAIDPNCVITIKVRLSLLVFNYIIYLHVFFHIAQQGNKFSMYIRVQKDCNFEVKLWCKGSIFQRVMGMPRDHFHLRTLRDEDKYFNQLLLDNQMTA